MIALGLAAMAFALALIALTRRRLLWGIAILGGHSLVLAGLYFALSAPDVALTEAAIGFGLVTFVYLLAIRRTGRIVVAAVECPPLIYPEGDGAAGLVWELLVELARRTHRQLELRWVTRDEVPGLLRASEADLAAGDLIPSSREARFPRVEVLPTRIVRVRKGNGPLVAIRGSREAELLPSHGRRLPDRRALVGALGQDGIGGAVLNLLELRALYLKGVLREAAAEPVEEAAFSVLFAPDEEGLARILAEILDELRARGRWDGLVRRYL